MLISIIEILRVHLFTTAANTTMQKVSFYIVFTQFKHFFLLHGQFINIMCKIMVLIPGGEREIRISSDGDVRRIFWGLKVSIPRFFWGGGRGGRKIWQVFFGGGLI